MSGVEFLIVEGSFSRILLTAQMGAWLEQFAPKDFYPPVKAHIAEYHLSTQPILWLEVLFTVTCNLELWGYRNIMVSLASQCVEGSYRAKPLTPILLDKLVLLSGGDLGGKSIAQVIIKFL